MKQPVVQSNYNETKQKIWPFLFLAIFQKVHNFAKTENTKNTLTYLLFHLCATAVLFMLGYMHSALNTVAVSA